MSLTANDLDEIREWVGSEPGDADVEIVYGRTGSVVGAALSILRTRRADLLAGPATWAVAGEYSESNAENLKRLDAQISALERLAGEPGADLIDTVQLVRCDTGR